MTAWPAAEAMAHYITNSRYSDLPLNVVEKAKTCLIDFIGSTLAPDKTGETTACLLALVSKSDPPQAHIYGTGQLSSVETAAFVNSARAASVICTDTFVSSSCHPGQSVLPPVLALSDEQRRSGPDIIGATVVGYEIMARLGEALVTPELAKVFRPTGLVAPTSAAAALCRLIGLDHEVTLDALSQATNAAGGFNAWAGMGSAEVLFHSSHAARSALTAVDLARAGIRFAPSILEGDAGLLAAFGRRDRQAELTRDLGKRFEILNTVFKPAPTCIYTQDACRLASSIGRGRPIMPQDIDFVDIYVTEAAARYPGCDNRGPLESSLSARMSLQFAVVALLQAGKIGPEFGINYEDTAIREVAARSQVIVDPELQAAYPQRSGTRIVISLFNGERIEAEVEDFRSMSHSEVVDRFTANAAATLGASTAGELLSLIEEIETVEDTTRIFELLGLSAAS